MKALILAAGLGTRLGPLTADLPKCMLSVDGRPLVERLVRWLAAAGIDDIAVNLHHRPDAVTAHLGDGSRFGVRITYSHEAALLGTAGALRPLADFFDGPFLIVYGDGFTNLSLRRLLRFHEARRVAAEPHLTMALFHVADPSACGIVELDRGRAPGDAGAAPGAGAVMDDDRAVLASGAPGAGAAPGDAGGRIRRFVEKPPPDAVFSDLASAGVLVCERGILDLVPPDGPADIGRDVLPLALARGIRCYGLPLAPDEYLIDIGTPAAYARATALARGVAHGS